MTTRLGFEIESEGLCVGVVDIEELSVRSSGNSFEEFERSVFAEIRARRKLEDLKDDPVLRSFRDLYWSFGMDPTKLRISSEALQRRVLRGLNLWRVSDIVDVINLASAYHALPISLFDRARLVGDPVVRTARPREIFVRIGGTRVSCRGREIVVADETGIVCFGYATHDSERVKIRSTTRNAVMLVYGAPAVTGRMLADAVGTTMEMLERWVECRLSEPAFYRSSC